MPSSVYRWSEHCTMPITHNYSLGWCGACDRNNEKKPAGTFINLTFHGTSLPQKVRLWFWRFDVDFYIPSPRRCFKCQKFGHNSRTCTTRDDVHSKCSITGCTKETCPNADNPKCLNCECRHSFPARLWMYCVWHSIQYQSTTTQQHPQRCTKTGTQGIVHQPSLQYVHGEQRGSFGRMSVEAVHALLSENSCQHWQPSTSSTTWIWPNYKRSVSSWSKWKKRND